MESLKLSQGPLSVFQRRAQNGDSGLLAPAVKLTLVSHATTALCVYVILGRSSGEF